MILVNGESAERLHTERVPAEPVEKADTAVELIGEMVLISGIAAIPLIMFLISLLFK